MKKYCIFDLDGTLVDSMGDWADTMIKILDDDNIDYPDDIINTITPLGNGGAAELFLKMGVGGTKEKLVTRMNTYAFDAYANRIMTKPGVKEFLAKLKGAGHILCVLTASPHITTDACLKNNGIYEMFHKVWSVTDFDLTKSQPQIYKKAAELLGADTAEITFFDDNLTALTTAKSAGLECVGVYDKTSEANTEKIRSVCDMYIKTFEELI